MRYSLIFIIAIAFITGSCQKDFLEVSPTSVGDEALWKDQSLAEAYIINLYTGIRATDKEPSPGDKSSGFGRGFHWAMWASITDEAIYSNDDQTYLVQRGQLDPSNYGWTSTAWARSYRGIRESNLALKNIGQLPITAERINMLNAEIRFIRAYRYFDLLKGFGGVPIIGDSVTTLKDDFSSFYDRKSIDETINYIVSELDAASAALPADNSGDWKRGRATKYAAMSLKSRVLLYGASPLFTAGANDVQKWQKAATAAKEIIDLNKFSLVTNLDTSKAENFRKYFLSGQTSEDIFMREYTKTSRSIPIDRMNAPNGFGGWGGNCPMQNFVDDFEMKNGKAISDPTSGYDPQNPYVNRDPRFYATVLYNGAPYRGRKVETFLPGGKDSPDGNEPWNTSPTGYYLRKFLNETISLDDWNSMGTTAWRYFRYAEILLNYAEAQNEAVGPDASVYDAINKIRARAGLPDLPSGLSQVDMRTRIRNERRIELAYEEHRYFDVRRWKIASQEENEKALGISVKKNDNGTFTYTVKEALTGKKFEEKHYWFPIPLDEINASGGAIEQNPGY